MGMVPEAYQRCYHLRAFTAALASLITWFTLLIMATPTVAEKVVWNPGGVVEVVAVM
jgi:hypothetical protein